MRRTIAVTRLIGFFCMGFGLTMLVPIALSMVYDDGETAHFIDETSIFLVVGLLLWFPFRRRKVDLRRRDGFLVVALFWLVVGLLAAGPFVLGAHLSFVDGLFEAVSGLTTTGATVMSGLDAMPPSLLFYRQQLQWLGGMGLIVLAVAVLPMLGIGGMQLYRAEAPGPLKEEKLTPRLASSARALWLIYVGITLLCALAYWLAGMSGFDAVAHSLATVSTGGFSTHDASLGYFESGVIESIAIAFMLLGGINFSVHFLALRRLSFGEYFRDVEVRSFLIIVTAAIVLIALTLHYSERAEGFVPAVRDSAFEVASVITSTGFGTVDFSHWPVFLPLLLIMMSFIGGCGGSTAGGIKVLRMLLLAKLGHREIVRLVHPRGEYPIKIGGRVVAGRISQGVWAFFSLYVVTFVVLMLAFMATGEDSVTAFSAIATCMNNLGPGLGRVAYHFIDIAPAGKLIAVMAMLLGRLEIFTVLVLLSRTYWRD
jgi:trk system potassium uptake protein TrkH